MSGRQNGFTLSSGPGQSSGFSRHNIPVRKPKKILYLMFIFFLLYWFGIRHGLGIERIPPLPLGYAVPGGRRGRKSSLTFDKKGMAVLKPSIIGQRREHPIYELMERAETRWFDLLSSQSKTLGEAAKEYKKRYLLDPPAGFDAWFAFCQEKGIKIVDNYDQMMKDLLPHHALKPETFVKRSKELEGGKFTYTIQVTKKKVDLSGERAWSARPRHIKTLVQGFTDWLPADFNLKVTGSDHDTGSVVLGRDQRDKAMELVREGKHFTEEEITLLEDPKRTTATGWFKACPMDSPANVRPGSENATNDIRPKSFIHDHLPTMDFCDYPELKRLHGAMHIDYDVRSPSILKPIMVLSKFPSDASFQTTPMEGYTNITDHDLPYLGHWEEKHDHRLFWRGSTTGGYDKYRDWKDSHRLRLHLMVNGPKGGDVWWDQQAREVMMPDGNGGFDMVRRWEKSLSQAYADVKLSGKPIQCPTVELCKEISNTIDFGAKVWPDKAAVYRYALDVDGNGWSSRFHRLLTTGSPVLKFTMFPEWHMVTPWYHYIPLKADYSDMYDIMGFFVGPLSENGEIDESKGHDVS
ncbi:CAP1-related protein [Kockovaella imperatae]|uniref:CAP1-related protein n=1 Tax=Kockovaella imperatae TaxID=4999 RepID=A0A1Y1UR78_9TREE|nr:CAP1-related protein [Kockovaella imperatae]ORX40087.1 CAP1-related protein [Kockovaella imperatae]